MSYERTGRNRRQRSPAATSTATLMTNCWHDRWSSWPRNWPSSASVVEADDPVLSDFLAAIVKIGKPARRLFDRQAAFVGATVVDTQAAIHELTDCQVVIHVAATLPYIPT